MRGTKAVLLVVMLTLGVAAGTASADPAADRPSALPPIAAPLALFTLTTIPDSWQIRSDLRPQLEIFADGRAVSSPDAVAADRRPETPPQRIEGHIPPEALRAAVAETAALATADLGMPRAADQSSRIIDYMPEPAGQDVHLIVYAPETTDGLGADQQAARKRFADLYKRLLDAFVPDN
ncbi:hypothetical protein OHA40_27655 [Nocardia sp. NBC_00508]|uniref:hypothetical protein n=1 Tax=Nocardia sp. NBC_00508 TaxID=2975992 RepID=UPI002E808476|nr:hypothetical protein [Nocardia sp. NBC_00508]WUD65370.1 hypothetical protein OHA40_27655 [Nocardia sp. NBC_00508]